jgi:hypothetical protein
MREYNDVELTFESMLYDPLIRLVMESDGVPAAEFVTQMQRAREVLLVDQECAD